MDSRRLELIQALQTELLNTLELYQKLDYEQTVLLWTTRLATLGPYAAGPTRWMEELKAARKIRSRKKREERINELLIRYELEESNLSDTLLPVLAGLIHGLQMTRVLLVGFGPGFRVRSYLRMLHYTRGTLHGVDILGSCAALVNDMLRQAGEPAVWNHTAVDRYHFQQGLATELTAILEEESYDLVTWERLGNHLVDDREWEFALGNQVPAMLKPQGYFVLCESLKGDFLGKELNKDRKMSPGSKFRSLDDYIRTLGPTMQLNKALLRETTFAGDDYVIAAFRKTGEPKP